MGQLITSELRFNSQRGPPDLNAGVAQRHLPAIISNLVVPLRMPHQYPPHVSSASHGSCHNFSRKHFLLRGGVMDST